MPEIKRIPTVFIPEELDNSDYIGDLFGLQFRETDIINILAWDDVSRERYAHHPLEKIGVIVTHKGKVDTPIHLIIGVRKDNELSFSLGDVHYKKETYSLIQNIFSRNTGILETDYMLEKSAFIFGCGSVGSLVATELAKAGVGKFVLVDNDIMNFHNLCRHQCGISDVGKYKVHAMRDRILEINPLASVETFIGIVESLEKSVFDKYCEPGTILIGCADNREADIYSSRLASIYNIPFVSIGFWERAFAGEVFYYIPSENMPCYECGIGNSNVDSSGRSSTNRRIYTTQEDLEKVNFEPGISIDINFVTLVAIKLILDILNRENPNFTPRVINYLTQFTLICNTNDPKIGGDLAEYFSHPLQITKSIRVQFREPCPPCRYQ
ncbi:MAG: ThiF family adenylyltransferase [Bacteroidetes bacterium]|nr:ThiF family adenylyltransferase [Bacteroidota bacterium]